MGAATNERMHGFDSRIQPPQFCSDLGRAGCECIEQGRDGRSHLGLSNFGPLAQVVNFSIHVSLAPSFAHAALTTASKWRRARASAVPESPTSSSMR